MKIAFIIGTRPELIKVAPVIWEAKKRGILFDVINTSQHKDLLEPLWKTLDVMPTHVLDVMKAGQSLTSLTARAVLSIEDYLLREPIKPTVILAQGDTTSVMAAAIVSYYNGVSYAHLEAGLRSFDLDNPFPEEFNRRVCAIVAKYHFTPTDIGKFNLLKEGIEKEKIYVTGNTIVDSLNSIRLKQHFKNHEFENPDLNKLKRFEKVVLVTCHRRENHGDNLQNVIDTIFTLSRNYQNIVFIWAVHPNPMVKDKINSSILKTCRNVILVEPLNYADLLKILEISCCAITDSGGIQEEAPSFRTPVIILRKTTERPEAINSNLAFLTDTDKEEIIERFSFILSNELSFDINPYGDGFAAKRVIDILTR